MKVSKVLITKRTDDRGTLVAWVMTDPASGYTEAYRTRQMAKMAAARYVATRDTTAALLAPPLSASVVNAYRRFQEVKDLDDSTHGVKVAKGKRFMALYKACESEGVPFEKVIKTLRKMKVAF